jgi:ribonuclease Z
MRRMIASRAKPPHTEWLNKDALRVIFCGTGSPMPDPERGQACTAVIANGRLFLFDAGVGAAERLQRFNLPQGALEAVLLTHFHSDHITGLPDVVLLTWAAGRKTPLAVYGGPGVEQVVGGFGTALGIDNGYRTAHHGPQVMPPDGGRMVPHTITLPDGAAETTVLDEGGVRIVAFNVSHAPVSPAYGYRIDAGGRSVVISGDTTPVPTLVAAAKNADVLIHEALAPHMVAAIGDTLRGIGDTQRAKIMGDIPTYHTSPVDAAKEANEAGVKLLVLSHVVPAVSGWLPERIFLRGVAAVRPSGVVVAHDGLMLELPTGSAEIRQTQL